MGFYWKPKQQAIEDFIEWIFADERKQQMFKYVPRGCWHCNALSICRDENNNWKCINGCMFIKKEPINYSVPLKLNTKKFHLFKNKLPTKRIVISAYKEFSDYKNAKKYIDFCLSNVKKSNRIIIVSSGSKGAIAIGERYAKQRGLEIERYLADWDTFGKGAGRLRNEQMTKASDYIICFWDEQSKEVKSVIRCAKRYNKPIKIKKI